MTRTDNSIRNIIFSVGGQAMGIIINFIARMVFVRYLTADYLGLNGLFTNIIGLLSLAEMGVGPAIIYALYKPLAEKNTEKVKSLMLLYKKAYIAIGIVVFALGACLYPFLPYFIKGGESLPNLNLIYFLFVFQSATSYFFIYKRSLIIADQKQYISSIYTYSFYFTINVLQCIVLVLTKNYILFLSVKIVLTILENYVVSKKAEKLYPYLKDKNTVALTKVETGEIYKNVRAMMLHRVGGTFVTGTDNIIISSFVGLATVGIYSNYLLITKALNTLLEQFFNAFTASLGNLSAAESIEKQKGVFDILQLICFWIYSFASISLLILFNPFIELWLGNQYLFSTDIVILIVFIFYVTGMKKVILINKQTLGLFYNDRYKPLAQVAVNLIVSIPLAQTLGIAGVLWGTIASDILVACWVEPYVLYKHGFKMPVWPYFAQYAKRFILFALTATITVFVSTFNNLTGISGFLINLLLCAVIPNGIFFLLYHNSKEFKAICGIVMGKLGKKKS